MRPAIVLLLVALLGAVLVEGHGYYRDSMPNGRKIPCDASCVGYCEGFGHLLNDGSATCVGGGEHPNHYLSSFGNTWQVYLEWNVGMCTTDSDNDGATNGDEMGDPCCVWSAGSDPSRDTKLSNPAQKDASFPFPSCTLAGAPVVNISQSSVSQSTLYLNWISTACVCGFNISMVAPKSFTNLQITRYINPYTGNAQLSIGALDPDTNYTFSVVSYNMGGSVPQTFTVKTAAQSQQAPGGPTNVKATASEPTNATISWEAPTSNMDNSPMGTIMGYELDMAGSDGMFRNIYAGSSTTYEATRLQANTTYQVRVRAINSNGVGASSQIVTMTTPAFAGVAVSASYTSEDGSFKLGWSIQGPIATFVMTGQILGYVAVGWGNTPTMTNTDMVVGSFDNSKGVGYVVDLWSTSQNTPAFDKQQDVTLVSATQQLSTTTITFTRPIKTGDSTQDVELSNRNMYLVWAIGNGVVNPSSPSSFTVHTKRGAANVNFFTGSAQTVNDDKYKMAHGGISFVAWGILIPLGSFIARYKRCDLGVWWYRLHVGLQMTGSVLTLIGFIIITTTLGSNYAHFNSTHAVCGLIMVILTIGQSALGFLSNYMYNHNRKRVPIFPDRVHGVIGLSVMLFGFVTIFLGFSFYRVNLGAWLLGAQCLLFAATAVFVYEFFDGKED